MREQAANHVFLARQAFGWSVATLLGGPFIDLRDALEWLPESRFAYVVIALFAAVGTAGTTLVARRAADRVPFIAFAIHAAGIVVLYALALPAVWFFQRYLAPVHAFETMLVAVGLAHLASREQRLPRIVGVLVGASALLAAAAVTASDFVVEPQHTIDQRLTGAKGYRDAAEEILANLPDGAVVASLQSGALAYFANGRVVVVNADGVVDRRAAEAFRTYSLWGYLRARGVRYVADWPDNLRVLVQRSRRTPLDPRRFRVAGIARTQGEDRFVLVELRQ
jgi:hypothetical protein